ncbi:MAG TPA: site-2 protease family protein [Phycisphaerae bacterium]|nr:site-2 protease family protein [Phycisphaerae bacterium]
MGIFDADRLQMMLLLAPGLLLSLTLHEVAHARTALAFGDPTARNMGRTSLNPLRHLDPIGTLALFFIGFGWAKPVPVNPANLHPPRMGDIAVSLAGPVTNLGLAVIFGLATRAFIHFRLLAGTAVHETVLYMLIYTTLINIILCVFNLIPLFPLDGHHVLGQIISPWRRVDYMRWQMQYGRILLIALIIGPGLLRMLTRNPNVPDPIGLLFSWARGLLLPLLGLQ